MGQVASRAATGRGLCAAYDMEDYVTTKQQQIITAFNAYMGGGNIRYNDWYVGVAADPRERLFNDHAVNEQTDAWIYDACSSTREAREVEQYFIGQGTRGGPGGGDANTKSVYAYRITSRTVE